MSRETEKIFKDLGKYLSDKEIKSDEDYNKATSIKDIRKNQVLRCCWL